VRLPCFPFSGSKLLALVVDTGEAYPQAPSEAVLWIFVFVRMVSPNYDLYLLASGRI
jgi:hypothetical protein